MALHATRRGNTAAIMRRPPLRTSAASSHGRSRASLRRLRKLGSMLAQRVATERSRFFCSVHRTLGL